jgi:hypothetical protein
MIDSHVVGGRMFSNIEHVGMAGWDKENAGSEQAGKGIGEGVVEACTVEA